MTYYERWNVADHQRSASEREVIRMYPCPRYNSTGMLPKPSHSSVELFECDICGCAAVVEVTDNGYRVYEALTPKRLRKGNLVLVEESSPIIIKKHNFHHTNSYYTIARLVRGGKNPLTEDGMINPVRIVAVLKPAWEVSQ